MQKNGKFTEHSGIQALDIFFIKKSTSFPVNLKLRFCKSIGPKTPSEKKTFEVLSHLGCFCRDESAGWSRKPHGKTPSNWKTAIFFFGRLNKNRKKPLKPGCLSCLGVGVAFECPTPGVVFGNRARGCRATLDQFAISCCFHLCQMGDLWK